MFVLKMCTCTPSLTHCGVIHIWKSVWKVAKVHFLYRHCLYIWPKVVQLVWVTTL